MTAAGSADERAYLAQLGLRVKVLRTGLRMSQETLAAAAGLDRTYVSRIERGQHNITVLTLSRVADVLGVAPGDLLPRPAPAGDLDAAVAFVLDRLDHLTGT